MTENTFGRLATGDACAAAADKPEKEEVKAGFMPLTGRVSVVMAAILGFDKKYGQHFAQCDQRAYSRSLQQRDGDKPRRSALREIPSGRRGEFALAFRWHVVSGAAQALGFVKGASRHPGTTPVWPHKIVVRRGGQACQ
ncbi:hypothetical protein D3878_16780 [Noviherbaspirillum sedimenti]|uniref:Uncharacterized protein n=1 Tax=Noviherbaspirillum sedimenti TaxID=2320865 RepID=A0A3A3G3G2_9BURK|nr:hypothetical protein D3878_16780 [Noviherbaspirillum sedimenti]